VRLERLGGLVVGLSEGFLIEEGEGLKAHCIGDIR
jgi:hypothetical protein